MIFKGLNSRIHHVWVVLAILCVLAVYASHPVLTRLDELTTHGGEEYLISYLIAWVSYIVPTDITRLLEVPFMFPTEHTLAFSDYFITQGMLSIPLTYLSVDPLASYNLLVVLAMILNPLSVYMLAYQLTKNTYASLVGAVIFGYSVGKFDFIGHLQVFSMYWVGFGLWSLVKYIETKQVKYSILMAVFLIIQGLDSVFMTFVLITAIVLMMSIVVMTKKFDRRAILRLGAPLMAGLIVVAIIYMPYANVVATYRYTRSMEDAYGGSAYWADYLYPTQSSRLRVILDTVIGKQPWPAYMGLGVTLLVAISVGYFWKRHKDWKVFSAMALFFGGLILSFGPYFQILRHRDFLGISIPLPYWLLYHVVPGFQGLRVPQRWSQLALLGGSLLIAMLAREFMKKIEKPWQLMVITGLMIFLVLAELRLPVFTREALKKSLVYERLASEPKGMVLSLPASTYPYPMTYLEIERLYHQAFIFDKEHRYVNGYSGFADPEWAETIFALHQSPELFLIAIGSLNPDYVILNVDAWEEMSTQIGTIFGLQELLEVLEETNYFLRFEYNGELLFTQASGVK